jgi:AraC family transcriptional regulator
MKNVLSFAIGLMVVAMMVGCGGGQQPAKTEKPAEPVFVAQVVPVDSMTVASLAKMGPYADAGKALTELMDMARKQNLEPVGPMFGVYYDNPAQVKPESAKYEVCFPVKPETKLMADKKTGFSIKKTAPMQVAVTDYMGPYDKVSPTYEKLYQWVGENKYQPAGPMMEWYLSDPSQVKPESLQAKIGAVVVPMEMPADTMKQAEEQKPEEPKEPTGK